MYARIDSTQVNKKGQEFVRVDFYLEKGEPLYDGYRVRMPARELTEKELTSLTGKGGNISKADYEAYVDKHIGWEMKDTPFNCHMFAKPATLEDLDDAVQARIKLLKANCAENAKTSAEFKPVRILCPLTVCAAKYSKGSKEIMPGTELAEA
ncbi:hypothetical protein B1778_04365 [Dehalococcoides mccartyi]|uniref:hypothetical protein n=1 Tax=Dehalococcoides mccartyi TaxID=61435 RepID=UPI0002B77374|nr:hypothetical protein [Dehalococcoides mccartyi]AGG07986.1 hypothetical protein btf_899 [Dehalococcoides mccartyi BTF08]AQU05969.1 hypothetical protein B1777_04550 [Dehalococcoides mccartyi]AQU07414.1 hypothetical protein B1778_04365 [Dehalococcoides mccartyi]AQW62517.1 hypothetical protein B1779_04370 [Dehalococcoides mccartyi]